MPNHVDTLLAKPGAAPDNLAMAATRPIVSLFPAATEMLFELGLGDRVAAVSHECNFPAEAVAAPNATCSAIDSARPSSEIDRQVRQRLEAGLSLYALDGALIRRLRPGLIVAQAQCDVCAIKLDDVEKLVASSPELADASIVAFNPMSLTEVLDDMLRLGAAAGVEATAAQAVARLRRRIAAVADSYANRPDDERPSVACIEWIDPLMLAGHWTPELIDMAGGRSVLAPPHRPSQYFTLAQLLAADPDVILIAPCGFQTDRAHREAQSLTANEHWRRLSAAQNDRVYILDGDAYFNRPGPRLVDTLELIEQVLCRRRLPNGAKAG